MASARTLLVRGRIYTGDWNGQAVTDALWAQDGVVRAIGAEARSLGHAHETWQLGADECAVPGFWDSHIHLSDYGHSLDEVSLGEARSNAQVRARLEAAAADRPADGTPLLGRGWMVGAWQAEPPHRAALDTLGARPVLLWNHDYHSLWVNGFALTAAGIDATTPDPPGGRIERDEAGEPTGVLRDAATDLVRSLWPRATAAGLERALVRAQDALWQMGVTAVCAIETDPEAVRALVRLHRQGRLRLRCSVYLPLARLEALESTGLSTGLGDDRLWLGGVKAFMDGALGSQTAHMREAYDEVGGTGLAMPVAAALGERLARLRASGLRLALHAIGDRAVSDAVLALAAGVPAWEYDRVEHAQLVPPDVVARWPADRVAASMQPVHLTDDLELMARFWGGERSGYAFPFASLRRRGVPLLFGSDAPVSDPNPLLGLWAAVERRRPGGAALVPEERIGALEALEAYAAAPARVEGRPHLGRLTPGSPLSVAVLSGDPGQADVDLAKLRVVAVEGT